MNEQWEVRPCTDRLGHVTSYDICLPSEPDATGVAVVASVYSGEAVANEIADAHNTPDPEAAAEIKALREVLERTKQWFAGYVANGGKGADEELQMLERFDARP